VLHCKTRPPAPEEAQAEIARRNAEVEQPKQEEPKKARVGEALVARAVELRNEGLGLVKLTRKLDEEASSRRPARSSARSPSASG
jgi:hypothetical protein